MIARRHGVGGQSLVEFALVVPFFAILLFSLIDMGRYVYTANALSNGTREGARAGSVGNRPSPACDGLARDACVVEITGTQSWGVPRSAITTTVTCERIAPNDTTPNAIAMSQCTTNDLLRVHAQTTFSLVTPIVAQLLGGLTIAADTKVVVNQ